MKGGRGHSRGLGRWLSRSGLAAALALTALTATAEPPGGDEVPATAPLAATPPELRVTLEPVHKLYERKRDRGPVYAAGQDEELGRWNLGGSGDPEHLSNRATYHPGTRVVVEVSAPPGALPRRAPLDRRTGRHQAVLSHTALLAQARRRLYWPLRLCYEDAKRRHPKLGGGKLAGRARLLVSGRLSGVTLSSSKLDDPALLDCARARLAELRFSSPPPRRLELTVQLQLWPGDAPLPELGPPEGSQFSNPGQLAQRALTEVLTRAAPELEGCFAAGRARDPQLWGRLALRLEQAETGQLLRIQEQESRFPDRDVTRCLIARLQKLTFPAPTEGKLAWVAAWRLHPAPRSRPPLSPDPAPVNSTRLGDAAGL